MDVSLKPVERLLFETDLALVADFRCRPDDRLFRNSGPSNANCIIFPSTSTKIIRRKRHATLESPADVSLMNRGEEYEREVISEEGTFTTWYTLADEVLDEILFDAGVRDLNFPVYQVRVPARTILEQRRLWAAIRAAKAIDPLAVEEKLIHLTRSILGCSARPEAMAVSPSAVERATEYLLAHFSEPLSLSDVARAAGASVSYLSRAFHSTMGITMSAYRQRVRLTRSLDLLPQYEGNVTDLALELGYSSHSHFTYCFRSVFAMSPTAFLRELPQSRI